MTKINLNILNIIPILWSSSLCLSLACFAFAVTCQSSSRLGTDSDKEALSSLKSHISHDPFRALLRWNNSIHFCKWDGVLCSSRHGRVIAIDLKARNLTGTIAPHIGNLSFLRSIDLRNNFFHGEIPQEIGRLYRLQSLGLTQNILQGKIPVELCNCSKLMILDLVINNLEGTIPEEIGRLSGITALGLSGNNLTGPIPRSISNLTSLLKLSLSENTLSGDIPYELGNLRKLTMFQVSVNRLTGLIPRQLFNVSSMEYFGATQNQLVGEIPEDIGDSLSNLRMLLLDSNNFTGCIPISIVNATKLERLMMGHNHLIGSVPTNLGKLKNLVRINLGMNSLGTGNRTDLDFLNSLVNCTNLQVLAFNNNSFGGILPGHVVANLSTQLNYLLMGANKISGQIPSGINQLESLLVIGMEENLFMGSIPSSIGFLKNLQALSIFGNRFSGNIPETLGNLSSLIELGLDENDLSGSLPSSLSDCLHLQRLGLSQNKLSGSIPKQVIGLSSLSDWLDLSGNKLTGIIPSEIGNLKNLRLLKLSDNHLSGQIPSSIVNCNSLELMYLSRNSFQGSIPSSLRYLKGVQELDLSRNNFTGRIPEFLGSLPFLRLLNLSFNNLDGEVPRIGIFTNMTGMSISGNERLCGGTPALGLRHCPLARHSKKLWHHLYFKIIIFTTICLVLCLAFLASILVFVKRKQAGVQTEEMSPLGGKLQMITYTELAKVTAGFSMASLIGTGRYGSVYKGCLGQGKDAVAIKVFNLQEKGATKSFTSECDALRNLRHRNLVKVITSCSSIDSARNEFKALVFEFMPNGSLEKWLHSSSPRKLSFQERLKIAADVGQALDYLHNHARPPVVHCDLKPSNVLLDEEMTARVGDFGLARILYDRNMPVIQSSLSTNTFRGTIGYAAPEYGLVGEVSTRGDVYSFGIMLLEMFTGKKPTDGIFTDNFSLRSYVESAIPDRVGEVTDQSILQEVFPERGEENPRWKSRRKYQEALVMVFKIGVLCSKELPGERMEMKEVLGKLQLTRDMDFGGKKIIINK